MTDDTRWTAAVVERLGELLREHRLSSRDIAGRLGAEFGPGFTRNMVIGKVRRLELLLPGRPRLKRTRQEHLAARRAATRAARIAREAAGEPLPGESPPDESPSPGPRPMPRERPSRLFDATVAALLPEPAQCRWPIGDPQADDYGYCGEERWRGKPYCRHHCNKAYQFVCAQ